MKNQFDLIEKALTISIALLTTFASAKDGLRDQSDGKFANAKQGVVSNEISPKANTLTAEEEKSGWHLLWDGKTSEGWRSAKSESFPSHGWAMKDGVLTVHDNNGEEAAGGGDIITRKRYSDFELMGDFKIT